jgi:hypothetical protein
VIDSGVCPWCQTIQVFTFYGRQECQICGKPITVTPDETGGDILQNYVDYWNSILNELLAMETELETLGLQPRNMITEVNSRIKRLTSPSVRQARQAPAIHPSNRTLHEADE